MVSARIAALCAAMAFAACAAVAEETAIPIAPSTYQTYDCDTLAVFDEALRKDIVQGERDDLEARYADVSEQARARMTPEQAARRLAWLRGHLTAVRTEFKGRNCAGRTSGGVASGMVWSMNPGKIAAYREAVRRAPFQAPPPIEVAASAGGSAASGGAKKPYPRGGNVAPPIAYSAAEIARYCEQGWDSRRLGDGTIEYNPCFYE